MTSIQFHAIARGDPRQPTVLLLHGFMGSGEDWLPVMDALAADYYSLALDLPGHGRTRLDHPPHYAMEATAQAIVDWINEYHPKIDLIVGYSMGGRLALYLALAFPHCFPQAVLISASPGLISAKARKTRRSLDLERSQQILKNFKDFLRLWYRQPLFASLWKTNALPALQQRRLRNNPEGLAYSLQYLGLGSQPSLWQELSCHGRSLTLIAGELDPKFGAIAAAMGRCCPTAEVVIIAGAGHNIPLEKGQQIVTELRRILQRPR